MMNTYFDLKGGQVHYIKMGHGKRTLIALHGFADEAEMFTPFADALGEIYTIYAIDLPFHGKTKWLNDNYGIKGINDIIEAVLKQTHCLSYDLLGFSLGGTITLSMLSQFIEGPEKIILLAPGGVEKKGKNSYMSMPLAGKRVAYYLTKRPFWIIGLVSFLTKIGVLNSFYIRYMKAHLREEEKHKRLFFTWFSLSTMKVNISKVKEVIATKKIETYIIVGSRDKVINATVIEKAFENTPLITTHNINSNHQMLNDEVAVEVLNLIMNPLT